MAYDFYLGTMLLPVSPSKLQIKIKNQNKTVTLINEGEVNILKQAGLSEISFTMLIPQAKYPFAKYIDGFQKASFYLDTLEKLKIKQKPFQFIISREFPGNKNIVRFNGKDEVVTEFNEKSLFGTNIKVSLEDYKILEDTNNGFDLNVDILLKQYRDYSTKIIKIIENQDKPQVTVTKERSTETAPDAKTYMVVKNDCLWTIAQRYLNNGNRYPEIYSLNQTLMDNANKGTGFSKYTIYAGQVLVLPDK